jgi:hypothetical protein
MNAARKRLWLNGFTNLTESPVPLCGALRTYQTHRKRTDQCKESEDSDAAKQRSPGLCRDKGKAPKSCLLNGDTALLLIVLRSASVSAEKNRAHHGFNPGCHLFRGNAIGSLEPAACGSKNGPGSSGRGE